MAVQQEKFDYLHAHHYIMAVKDIQPWKKNTVPNSLSYFCYAP